MRVGKHTFSKKQIASVLGLMFVFFLGFVLLNSFDTYLQEERLQNFLDSTGLLAPIIYIAIYVVTLILAPFTGYPLFIAGIGLFGIVEAVILSYIASLIGATANFYIARLWGRPILKKLVGKNGVERIDKLALNFGKEALILSRLFQAFLFEWISYAAGLTTMNFKTYIAITAIFSIPISVASIILGTLIPNLGSLFVAIAVMNYITLTIPFFYFGVKRLLARSRR